VGEESRGIAAASTAGNAAAVPAIVAGVNPAYKEAAAPATVLVAASVVITAILVPFATAFLSRKTGSGRNGSGRADVEAAEGAGV
jgi:2-keto-3-deoxygluconate permease